MPPVESSLKREDSQSSIQMDDLANTRSLARQMDAEDRRAKRAARSGGEASLVTHAYEVNGEVAGVLGVIGPTRMQYQDVIPVVDVTARLLSAAMRRS